MAFVGNDKNNALSEGRGIPVAFSTTVLLGLVGVFVDMTRLGKISRKVLLRQGGPIGKAGVVTVSVLMGASH